jgi:hypothetical protein
MENETEGNYIWHIKRLPNMLNRSLMLDLKKNNLNARFAVNTAYAFEKISWHLKFNGQK